MKISRWTTTLLAAALLGAGAWTAPALLAQEEEAPAAQAADEKAHLLWPEKGDIPLVDVDDIQYIVDNHGTDLLVINLWASWCAPCVAELPYFQAAHEEFKEQGVQFVGVGDDLSVYGDSWKAYADRVIETRKITYPNFQMTGDHEVVNAFFSEDWGGALPATFLYNSEGEKVAEYLGELSREQLFEAVRNALDGDTG